MSLADISGINGVPASALGEKIWKKKWGSLPDVLTLARGEKKMKGKVRFHPLEKDLDGNF